MNSPFHAGEQSVQSRLGVRETIEPWARRVVRSYLPDEHRDFYAQLPFLVTAARDSAGRPWVTLLTGEPGFVSSPGPDTLRIAATPGPGDALAEALQGADDVGFLGIGLDSRRRNRVNGRVAARVGDALEVSVGQSFGNCPQYITERKWFTAPDLEPVNPVRGASLSGVQEELIRASDTFFIATGYRGDGESETFGMDASHRGGTPGFVEVTSQTRLTFPDYAGNNHFNSIGNLLLDPRAGLAFVDFEHGHILQLTGRTQIDWDSPEVARFAGARRLVHFEIDQGVWREAALSLRWLKQGDALRELRLIHRQTESADVTSFVFAARDGAELPKFDPGQHLPIELDVPGEPEIVRRTYSLSSAPGADEYRISVKREPMGVSSGYLHDQLAVNDIIAVGKPQGTFTFDPSSVSPIALVSAGIGLTPLVSMLHQLAEHSDRPVLFVYGARDGEHHPLRSEIEEIERKAGNVRVHVAYSRPLPADRAEHDYQSSGRVDATLLDRLIPGLDAEFYICGPTSFMAAIESQLEDRGVSLDRVHSESFGPAA